ncbi:MAG: hypothetical protein CL624_01325 [Arcobacter sp.]|uniref:Uncharacterized protein n=1 Tax=Poseidonibacter ostreae TaxID=2654171 RepID=A0ABQ6VS89_9BACT|nr:hypothetical protein GA417_11550 [Poseidonibacter ostreae]KAB7893040.1 hypothetical protein GBG18_00100 [Poseidonibacter ostreae]MAC82753.1 hypothetical protein [Arcobacter sp.]
MARFALILFIASELCYYLLIAQTGVVEYFSSDIIAIAPLPIGGMIGSFLTYYLKISNKNKIAIFLSLQLLMSFFYPNFSIYTLFILGISVGALAPLLINELKKARAIDLGLALSISYAFGTLLFNYEVSLRGSLAIILTIIPLICLFFLATKKLPISLKSEYSLFVMVLWIFLDSALFETLSRDINISIWRDGYTLEIVLFHIIGVFTALKYQLCKNHKELIIIVLFALSYLLYFLQEAFILSLVYPFVISYYNVAILQTILKKDLKVIAVYMIFIGWIASGAGLFVALNGLTLFVPIIFLLAFLNILNSEKKELNYA